MLSVCSITAQAESLDRIVAIVNDTVITQSQLQQQVQQAREELQLQHVPLPAPAELQQKVLQHLIDVQLQLQLAKKMGITVSDNELDQAIAQIATRNGLTATELRQKIQEQKMNYDQYREKIREQILVGRVQERSISSNLTVSDQEVQDALLNLKKDPSAQMQASKNEILYRVQDFLIPLLENASAEQIKQAQQQAQQLATQLRSSDGKIDLTVQSTDLGWRKRNQLPQIFAQALQNKHAGDAVGPIRAPNGFHVLKILGTHGDQASQPVSNIETHVRHILIKVTPLQSDAEVKLRLERIRNDIVSGGDFAVQAKENSQDPGSASKGGDLGWASSGMFDPSFEAAMNQLKINEMSEPIKTPFGWHLIQVLGRRALPAAQQLTAQAKKIAYERKYQEAVQRWLKQLRSQAYIKIMN